MNLRVLFRQLSLTAGSVRRSSGRHSLANRTVAIMAHRPLDGHACVRKGIRQAMDD